MRKPLPYSHELRYTITNNDRTRWTGINHSSTRIIDSARLSPAKNSFIYYQKHQPLSCFYKI